MKFFKFIIILFYIFLSSCQKEDELISKTISDPKGIINNTSGWKVSSYYHSDVDSTVLFNKYKVSFNEDPTCAERIKFISPFVEIHAVWDTYDYPYGTVMRLWVPDIYGFSNIDGEWNFYYLSSSKIGLFRDSSKGGFDKLIFEKI